MRVIFLLKYFSRKLLSNLMVTERRESIYPERLLCARLLIYYPSEHGCPWPSLGASPSPNCPPHQTLVPVVRPQLACPYPYPLLPSCCEDLWPTGRSGLIQGRGQSQAANSQGVTIPSGVSLYFSLTDRPQSSAPSTG